MRRLKPGLPLQYFFTCKNKILFCRINDLLAEATKLFAIEYSKVSIKYSILHFYSIILTISMFKAYTQVVIKIAKEELTPKEDMLGPLKLKTAPPSEMKGKTGILVKV